MGNWFASCLLLILTLSEQLGRTANADYCFAHILILPFMSLGPPRKLHVVAKTPWHSYLGFQGCQGISRGMCCSRGQLGSTEAETEIQSTRSDLRSFPCRTLQPQSHLNSSSSSHLPGPYSKERKMCWGMCGSYPTYLLTLQTFYFSTVLDHQIPKRGPLNSSFKVSFFFKQYYSNLSISFVYMYGILRASTVWP